MMGRNPLNAKALRLLPQGPNCKWRLSWNLCERKPQELVSINMKVKKQNIIIASIYRPPKKTADHQYAFLDLLGDYLAGIDRDSTITITGGDVNLDWQKNEIEPLKGMLNQYELDQIAQSPTHGKHLIDRLYAAMRLKAKPCEHLAPMEKQHHVLKAIFNLKKKEAREESFEFMDYKKANWKMMKQLLNKKMLNADIANVLN
uniref:Uncharacterized protein n=1 Tax=Acrobeloides nanus TaxID=290746 RepID=A0A914C508_9BILA